MLVSSRYRRAVGVAIAVLVLGGCSAGPPVGDATTVPSTAPVFTSSASSVPVVGTGELPLRLVDESVGVAARYPAGWHPADQRLSVATGSGMREHALRELLVLGTGDLGEPDQTCPGAPAEALESMGASDVLLWLVEWEPIFLEPAVRPGVLASFISDGSLSDCARAVASMDESWEFLRWTEQGRGFWLVVAYGADTSEEHHADVRAIVQSLEFFPPGVTGPASSFVWTTGWSEAPDHRVAGRALPTITWTGTEYIVWGGEKPSEGEWHKTGAAFSPSLRRWRDLAPSPLARRSEHVAVWTGSEMLICCGREMGAGASAGAYDPTWDRWRVIAPAPISPTFAEAIWTGDEMMVFGGVSQGGLRNLSDAAAYNPVTKTWRSLADLPYGLEREAEAVLGDGVVYAWPSWFGHAEATPAPLAYDLDTDSWQPLLTPEGLDTPASPSLVWTGHELLAWGLAPSFDNDQGIGVAFEPATGTWRPLPAAPLEPTRSEDGNEASQAATWTGSEMVVWTGWIGTEWEAPTTLIVAYDPNTQTWRHLDPAPVPSIGLWHRPLIWTGTQLLVYGERVLIYTP